MSFFRPYPAQSHDPMDAETVLSEDDRKDTAVVGASALDMDTSCGGPDTGPVPSRRQHDEALDPTTLPTPADYVWSWWGDARRRLPLRWGAWKVRVGVVAIPPAGLMPTSSTLDECSATGRATVAVEDPAR